MLLKMENRMVAGITGVLLVGWSALAGTSYRVTSPDGRLEVRLWPDGGQIRYELDWNGQPVMGASSLSILPGGKMEVSGHRTSFSDTTWRPVWGQFSEIRNRYTACTFDLDLGAAQGRLLVHAYDEGVGFRFEMTGTREVQLDCTYALDEGDVFYFPEKGNVPGLPVPAARLSDGSFKLPKLYWPVVVKKTEGRYIAILESDLYSTPGFATMDLDVDREKKILVSSNRADVHPEKGITPWRVVLVGGNMGDMVTSTVAVNLAAPCALEDTSWIKPGKALWDWRVHGFTTKDGFTYGSDTKSYLRFIDFAAQQGIEYFLIDDAWYTDVSAGHMEASKAIDMKLVASYAKEKGVDLILYYDRHLGVYGDPDLFAHYRSMSMSGIKYGFMSKDAPFTRNAVRDCAENHLLIDFHDNPVPLTGARRTMPNAITREYCHAQQDYRKVFTPESFINMALVNAIQGPMDMNNGNFDIVGIKRGDRIKGPRERGRYFTTVVSETARTLVVFSGLVCIPDAPEAYLAKADLFEFIRRLPVGRWDESRVLHGEYGRHISVARRHGEEWFIGTVVNQKGGTLPILLDFLNKGVKYEAVLFEDDEATHGNDNPEAYRVHKRPVVKGEIVQAVMAPGGGHAMWISPSR